MIVLPLLMALQTAPPKPASQTPGPTKPVVQRTDAIRLPIPPEKPAGFTEVETPATRANDPINTGKLPNVWSFRRNNPRSTYRLAVAPKPGGRPALVDAAGKPVTGNLVFTVKNPSLGPVKVYATKLARGPFFTGWTQLPKNSAGKYLQITGTLLTASEIRSLVAGVRLLAASRAPQKGVGGDPYEKDAGEDKSDDGATVNGSGGAGKTTGGGG